MTTDATQPPQRRPELEPGALLRGKYRVERVLGQGGMGVVLGALHLDLDRQVAVKVLHAELRHNADLVERFVREGRAASKIEGDHVARVFDVDRMEDGTPFLVMEYLDGRDLSYVRRERAPLPIGQAIEYVLQACAAIGQAHARGVIHRDVKPANLFLTRLPDGTARVKVLDFGISKLSSSMGGSEPSFTRTTLVMGSVEYMSPEQMLSTRDVDGRTDIWALGVVLFELLTASAPFTGETATQVCAHVMSQPPLNPRSLRHDLPEVIEEVIFHCLEKDRNRRYPTVEDLARALRATIAATHVGLGPVTRPTPDPAQPPPTPRISDAPTPAAIPTTVLPEAPRPSDPPASETRLSQPAPPIGSGQGSSTSVGVASDPIPQPPTKRGMAPRVAALLVVVAALGAVAFAVHSRLGRTTASSTGRPASPISSAPPIAMNASPSATAVATLASASATSSSTAAVVSAAATSASASASASAKRPQAPVKQPTATRPTFTPRPTKTSGID